MGTSQSRAEKQGWMEMMLKMHCDGKIKPISKEYLLSLFILRNRSSRRTGLEILKAMETTKHIRIDGDEIWSLK